MSAALTCTEIVKDVLQTSAGVKSSVAFLMCLCDVFDWQKSDRSQTFNVRDHGFKISN